MAGLTGRGVLPLLKLPNAGILATQSYSTEVGIRYLLCELKYCFVLRIRDVYPGSRILNFIHPGFRFPEPTATKDQVKKILGLTFL
jgi:hypothetical protein